MILDKIVGRKEKVIQEQKLYYSVKEFIKEINNMEKPPSFYEAVAKEGLSIIGEIKKASPSKGLIKEDLDPVKIALEYEKSVDAISILTEEDFFKGSPEYLKSVSNVVKTPLLRKDFIISRFQIYEARVLGASCVLLITSILKDEQLKEYIELAESLNMDALVEVHTKEEVERALNASAKIIGINNRNLKDFSIDLNTTLKLRRIIPENILVVSESGIHNEEDIKFLREVAIDGILVGESFMKSQSIAKKAGEFKRAYEY
jgi:indole-3-glycerol phosphate synthase